MGAELHVPDEWANPYVGKSYKAMRGGSLGAQSSWEVFTMGAESLFNGSPYFDRRDGDDVEFRRFMLGVLSAL